MRTAPSSHGPLQCLGEGWTPGEGEQEGQSTHHKVHRVLAHRLTVHNQLYILLQLSHIIQVQSLASVQAAAALIHTVQVQHSTAGVCQRRQILPAVLQLQAEGIKQRS